jgi:hypothetical protein
MTKPVDLIVANIMHEANSLNITDKVLLDTLEQVAGRRPPASVAKTARAVLLEQIARKLLCEIAHGAPMVGVFKALAAVKAPSSIADIEDGMQAVQDRSEK